ncbi:MAG: hypothetical protein M1815_004532 [Lichina confinis]|nr:MAG: hypothetical protein M1815_004532 [Lichina confinis]
MSSPSSDHATPAGASGGAPKPTPEYLAEDISSISRIGMITAFAVAFAVVSLRFYARAAMMGSFGLDDWLMVVTTVFAATTLAMCMLVLHYGAGRHIASIPPSQLAVLYKHLVGLQLIYHLGLYVLRVSGLAFYARLWKNADRSRTHMMMGFIFVTVVATAQSLILGLQCIPLKALWKDGPGRCLTQYSVFISTAAMTIVCDSLVLLIPLRIIWHLKMTVRRKVALGVVLLLGVLAVLMSVVRIIAMVPAVTRDDPTWYYASVLFWSSVEMSSAMVALSAPALKPLFGTLISGTTQGTRNHSSYRCRKGQSGLTGLRSTSFNPKSLGSAKGTSHHRTAGDVSAENTINEDAYHPDEEAGGIRKTVEVKIEVRDS